MSEPEDSTDGENTAAPGRRGAGSAVAADVTPTANVADVAGVTVAETAATTAPATTTDMCVTVGGVER